MRVLVQSPPSNHSSLRYNKLRKLNRVRHLKNLGLFLWIPIGLFYKGPYDRYKPFLKQIPPQKNSWMMSSIFNDHSNNLCNRPFLNSLKLNRDKVILQTVTSSNLPLVLNSLLLSSRLGGNRDYHHYMERHSSA